jgi:hypothetical protein
VSRRGSHFCSYAVICFLSGTSWTGLNSPSVLEMTTVATPFPMRFVMARASDMNRSTPRISAIPSTGMEGKTASVAASVTNPDPVTPAAPFDVNINTASRVICCQILRSTPYA